MLCVLCLYTNLSCLMGRRHAYCIGQDHVYWWFLWRYVCINWNTYQKNHTHVKKVLNLILPNTYMIAWTNSCKQVKDVSMVLSVATQKPTKWRFWKRRMNKACATLKWRYMSFRNYFVRVCFLLVAVSLILIFIFGILASTFLMVRFLLQLQSLCFAAFTTKLGIPAAMCAVTLLNRLNGDQVTLSFRIDMTSRCSFLHEWRHPLRPSSLFSFLPLCKIGKPSLFHHSDWMRLYCISCTSDFCWCRHDVRIQWQTTTIGGQVYEESSRTRLYIVCIKVCQYWYIELKPLTLYFEKTKRLRKIKNLHTWASWLISYDFVYIYISLLYKILS